MLGIMMEHNNKMTRKSLLSEIVNEEREKLTLNETKQNDINPDFETAVKEAEDK